MDFISMEGNKKLHTHYFNEYKISIVPVLFNSIS